MKVCRVTCIAIINRVVSRSSARATSNVVKHVEETVAGRETVSEPEIKESSFPDERRKEIGKTKIFHDFPELPAVSSNSLLREIADRHKAIEQRYIWKRLQRFSQYLDTRLVHANMAGKARQEKLTRVIRGTRFSPLSELSNRT